MSVLWVLCLAAATLGPGAVASIITFQSSNTAACSGTTQALVLTTADLSGNFGASITAGHRCRVGYSTMITIVLKLISMMDDCKPGRVARWVGGQAKPLRLVPRSLFDFVDNWISVSP